MKQANEMTINNERVGTPIYSVDNFDELLTVCNNFLNSSGTEEVNLREEFNRIAEKW